MDDEYQNIMNILIEKGVINPNFKLSENKIDDIVDDIDCQIKKDSE